MPHFDENGNDTWLCQKCAKVKSGRSIWVEQDSEDAIILGYHGNVCMLCIQAVRFVVVSAKPRHGSRVMSAGQPKEAAEQSLTKIKESEDLKPYGPFHLVGQDVAERRKLYGD